MSKNEEGVTRRQFLVSTTVVTFLGTAAGLNVLDDMGDSRKDDKQQAEINKLKKQVEELKKRP
jgi:hypothetical protein